MQWHQIKQYVEDVRVFIEHIRETFPNHSNSRVLLFGLGYGGSISVWFKHLYNNLVDGVWAVTAPEIAQLNLYQYGEAVGSILREVSGDECSRRVERGCQAVDQVFLRNEPSEIAALQQDFNLCTADGLQGKSFAEHNGYGLSILISIQTSFGT